MEQLSNRALISRLYTSAEYQLEQANYNLNNWQEWYKAVAQLDVPEKMVYVIVKLNQNVTKGGFLEFYRNSFGIFAPEIVHALNEINAIASAEIVSDSLSVVNPSELIDDAYKQLVFNIQLNEEQSTKLFSLDLRYDQLHGHENLEDLLGAYLQGLFQ